MRSVAFYGTLGALVLSAGAAVPSGTGTPTAPGGLPLPLREAREAVGTAVAARAAAVTGIDWASCPETEELPGYAECGEVSVPVDYSAPHGRKLTLTVSRKRATGPAAERQGPLLHNPGGPGADSMDFPLHPVVRAGVWKKLNRAYDFVGYAPRGVGRSAPLHCRHREHTETTAAEATQPGGTKGRPGEKEDVGRPPQVPSDAYKRELRRQAAAFAKACALRNGGALGHFTTADNARDLDVLRSALHREKLDYLGTSYGGYLGAVYATLFPGHVRRLVLDSVVDPRPGRIWYGDSLAQSRALQHRWEDFTSWTARHHSVYGLGRGPQAVQRRFGQALAAFDGGQPGGRASRQVLRAYLAAGRGEESWPRLALALAEFHRGDRRALKRLAASGPRPSTEQDNSDSVYSAVQCSEGHWPRTWSRWDRDHTAIARVAPYLAWEGVRADLPCAYWKSRPSRPVDVHASPGRLPPVLLLAAARDAVTPYEGAVETWKRLPGSSLVTENGSGTHGVAGGNRCADAHLAAYLLTGGTPGRRAECPARPAPRPLPGPASTRP
ncbi:alpha/beta hydrolase [Streptomyces marispadix]|uniref:Alpha/beta hydrolase n=1 Tax=Streptomyces marispadix TaxID=2922868 RepID=A0ABS9T4K6_9ACTN|nr:alpha/beta hydrolase [Streptomyces marispadix]MCH6163206.1 alpha/beta hydrolase [Streptomyces marispadix]